MHYFCIMRQRWTVWGIPMIICFECSGGSWIHVPPVVGRFYSRVLVYGSLNNPAHNFRHFRCQQGSQYRVCGGWGGYSRSKELGGRTRTSPRSWIDLKPCLCWQNLHQVNLTNNPSIKEPCDWESGYWYGQQLNWVYPIQLFEFHKASGGEAIIVDSIDQILVFPSR